MSLFGWNFPAGSLRVSSRASGAGLLKNIPLAVHAGTKSQGYKGPADWDAIGEIAQRIKIIVLGNGDLQSHEKAQERIRQYRLRGALIGRAAMGNPWIFLGKNKSDIALAERLRPIRHNFAQSCSRLKRQKSFAPVLQKTASAITNNLILRTLQYAGVAPKALFPDGLPATPGIPLPLQHRARLLHQRETEYHGVQFP